jgi:hypothetical protein
MAFSPIGSSKNPIHTEFLEARRLTDISGVAASLALAAATAWPPIPPDNARNLLKLHIALSGIANALLFSL